MAKRKARGTARELTRAEMIALERRASAAAPVTVATPVAEAEPMPAPATAGPRRGVLPPRVSRVTYGTPTLTREQELNYVRGDLRRLIILSVLMIAILVVLAFFLR